MPILAVVGIGMRDVDMKTALVLYGATDLGSLHFSSDMLWRTRLKAPDGFWLVEIDGRAYALVSALEYGRAKKEAVVEEVILLERQRGEGSVSAVRDFLRRKKVTHIVIPDSFPYGMGRELTQSFCAEIRRPPFFPERARKSKWEIGEIVKVQRAGERAASRAIDFLSDCAVRGHRVYSGKKIATSEMLRAIIDRALFDDGCLGLDTIASCGVEAADPHAVGRGPLLARQPIVLDIFPVSRDTHYYADMTRTVFKGEPSEDLKNMYEAVRQAQDAAIAKVRPGADGSAIHKGTARFFESRGYPTNFDKKPEGFIHGLGHGVGIDIHELPSLASTSQILEEGNVVTVEPGLYYHRARRGARGRSPIPAAGIRLEDMVLVTKTGHKNLTQFPKTLAEVIIP